MEERADIAIIGGTANIDSGILSDVREVDITTPFGRPSGSFTIGNLEGARVALVSRHGKDHSIPPHKINFKANIDALSQLGVKRIIATATVGSLREDFKAGHVVIPDQFIDQSREAHTFYGKGNFFHVSMADPFCPEIRKVLIDSAGHEGATVHEKGTYIKIDGPQFSTRAQSIMNRQFADIVGMTCIPEAILAREREICLAVVATVTDYDVWADTPVTFEEIKNVMRENLETKKKILQKAAIHLLCRWISLNWNFQ